MNSWFRRRRRHRLMVAATVLAVLALSWCQARAERVKASFYSKPQAVACAGMGRFDPGGMSAAHRTLDCGTDIEVTNLRNGLKVVVTITDYGPAKWTGNGLDLSREAARRLDMIRAGIVWVSYRVIPKPSKSGTWSFGDRFHGCEPRREHC